MTQNLPLHLCMCKFTLKNGVIHNELEYADVDGANGWKTFPFKSEVVEIEMCKRSIMPKNYPLPHPIVKGFAIHWVGTSVMGTLTPYAVREIMIVMGNLKVMCFGFNLKTKRWQDYIDNLKSPERPHLLNYDLSVHGM